MMRFWVGYLIFSVAVFEGGKEKIGCNWYISVLYANVNPNPYKTDH
jgi:hypothetical protein